VQLLRFLLPLLVLPLALALAGAAAFAPVATLASGSDVESRDIEDVKEELERTEQRVLLERAKSDRGAPPLRSPVRLAGWPFRVRVGSPAIDAWQAPRRL
jgi:hypothetical protein